MHRSYKTRVLLGLLAFALSTGSAYASGILIAARDTEDFAGRIPDQIAKTPTIGAVAGATALINTTYQVNGIGDGGGFLFAGSAVDNNFLTIDYNGVLLTSTTSAAYNDGPCCNEDIAYDPTTGLVYRAIYSDRIVATTTAGVLVSSDPETDAVGMAFVGSELWISKWSGREVGVWNPITGVYTHKFNTDGVGGVAGNAGGLAYDPFDNILWIGFSGGLVVPWALDGTRLGAGYLPFGVMDQTIDGLVFLGEATPVPEPATMLLLGTGLAGAAAAARRRRKGRA